MSAMFPCFRMTEISRRSELRKSRQPVRKSVKKARCVRTARTLPSVLQLARRYEKQLEAGSSALPFQRLVWCTIGNPHMLGQKPITYFRQVLALCEYPQVRRGGHMGATPDCPLFQHHDDQHGTGPPGRRENQENWSRVVPSLVIALYGP